MPRIARSHIKTSFFHIMTQGINQNFIFNHSQDIKYYILLIYKYSKLYNIRIIAYCIMNNHAHILLESENLKNLSKFMQIINSCYGKFYNSKYNRVGYVFRDRYKSEGIYSQEQLYCCTNYIYNNPVKAGICNHPSKYPFSNYKENNINIENNFVFIDIEENKTELCKKIIEKYLKDNSITIEQLKIDTYSLKCLILTLKNDYNISFRKIALQIGIDKEVIRNLYKYS